ncbi:MAG: polyprenyl synthetase family protein [Actinomycetota bacterium]
MASGNPLSVLPTLEADLERVEHALMTATESDLDMLQDAAQHYALAGGKRVRPGFAIAAAATNHAEPRPAEDDVVMGGVAVELVHLGSLYHDDVMDEATTRRSVVAANARWGNVVTILTGDFLLAQSSIIASALGQEVSSLLGQTIAELTDGQIRELQDTDNLDRTVESYEAAISGKTASLLACACRIGGLCEGLDRPTIDALTEFGTAYGMAFQIVDDLLDVLATTEQLGKPAGNDILEGNFTLPVMRALNSEYGAQLRDLIEGGLTPETRDQALILVRMSPGIPEGLETARTWADKAKAALSDLPSSPGATALNAAADHLVERARTPLG